MLSPKRVIVVLLALTLSYSSFAQDFTNIEFTENKGQWDKKVRYKGDYYSGSVFIRSTGFTIVQHNAKEFGEVLSYVHNKPQKVGGTAWVSDPKKVMHSHAWNVDFINSNPNVAVVPDKPAAGYNNYMIGDRANWASNCKIYQAVTLQNIYPNIDVRYYTYNGVMKYDIIARPGADISKIAMQYEGANSLAVKNKELVIGTSVGERVESAPYSFQYNGKERKQVNVRYVVKGKVLSFDVKGYDPTSTLVIDPSMIFCSLSGSSANNWGFTATYGSDGSFFGGGIVFSGSSFPVSPGAFQTTYAGGYADLAVDIGIIKLSPTGANRLYATYIGGEGNEQPHSIVADGAGNLFIAGRTNSPRTGPTSFPLLQTSDLIASDSDANSYDIIVVGLNPTGTGLIGTKRVGGSADDGVNINATRSGAISLQQNYGDDGRSEVILDGANNVYVASSTQSANFPIINGFQTAYGGNQDACVLKFSPNLGNVLFTSYLGGSGADAGYVLSISPTTSDIYVAGGTAPAEKVAYNGFPGNHAGTIGTGFQGEIDGYVAQISNGGNTLIRSTFIGTGAIDQVYGIQFDRLGFPYVMGQTHGNWPVINAAFSNNGGKQFIAKLQPNLSAYVYSTKFGTGSAIPNISPTAFLVDRCENVYVSGWGGIVQEEYKNAGTTGLPLVSPLQSRTDGSDFYFFVLQKNAASQLFGSFFGQNGGIADHVDGGTSRFDANGVIYQGVCANCGENPPRYPTTPGVWGPTKPRSAQCNLGMIKIALSFAGVGSDVNSSINGVVNDSAGCVPLDVVFTDGIRNATEYIWNFGDGSPEVGPIAAAQGYTQTHTYNNIGNYRVRLIAIDPNSCNVRDTSYINIRVGNLRANLAASFVKLEPCTEFNYQFTNLSTTSPVRPFNNTSFTWNFGDRSPRVIAGLNQVNHTYPAPGTYQAYLVLNDTDYCNYPDSLPIEVRVAVNVKAAIETPATGCAPYDAYFNNISEGGLTFEWNFGDPASGANNISTETYPRHNYQLPGTYTVTLVANDPNTCNRTDTTRINITIYDKPVSNFSFTPTTPEKNTPNVFINNASANAVRFKWLFGDEDSLVTTNRAPIQHQYNETGTYNACLVAFNAQGCTDTFCLPVPVEIDPLLDVPNAFTPLSNDINSRVGVRGFGIAKMRFIIWNRWGQKVFETGTRSELWDGRVKGVVQPMDVYAYTLDVEFVDGKKATKKGDITLIR